MQDQTIINALRMLSVDAVQQANSGHPGLPLGAAPMAYAIWDRFLQQNPANPCWINRDRFVLSAGHGSALLYSLLHVFGFDMTTEDLKQFRQLDSRTPGHPEYGHTPGVEATTGPLGQGLAMAVGMAIAEAHLNETFRFEDSSLIDHHTYVLASDGDLMEGITNEASSLAGTLALEKLIVLYDSNDITIEGNTNLAFHENVRGRYEALGWDTLLVEDGNDVAAIVGAVEIAKKNRKPTLIEVRTQIGYGSPRVGTAKSHGEPLGADNVQETRTALGWDHPPFVLPEEVSAYRDTQLQKGKEREEAWENFKNHALKTDAGLQQKWDAYFGDPEVPEVEVAFEKPMATRVTSSLVLNAYAEVLPNLMGGSADLGPSNKSTMEAREAFHAQNRAGTNMHFGIREHAMTAVLNGMVLHGGLRPYGATFLIFSDYMKPAIRLAALMGLPVTYILTHDSIGVGEDGPTHQPIEQLAMLRSIPNMTVFRPADGKETLAAWRFALTHKDGPVALALTRQNLPQLDTDPEGAAKGAYVLRDVGTPDVILIATGSEVSLAMLASERLEEEGIRAQVVSMPSRELFLQQEAAYRERVLPEEISSRVVIEAAGEFGWGRFIGFQGAFIGLDGFGASGPAGDVFEARGITVSAIVNQAKALVERGE